MNDITLAGATTDARQPAEAGAGGFAELRVGAAGATAIVVLGMHRSGTSALTGMLHHLGVALGERLMPATIDNPRGYWEHTDIVAAHDRLLSALGSAWDDIRPLPGGFEHGEPAADGRRELAAIVRRDFAEAPLWALKDPRLCRLMPLWSMLFDEERISPRYILALRHPLDVAASLDARDGISTPRALLLWLGHLFDAERATRGRRRAIVHYEALIGARGWRPVAAQLVAELDLAWPQQSAAAEAAVDAFLAPELRRRRVSDTAAAGSGRMQAWVETVYAAFRAVDPRLGEICDAVRCELETAGDLFLPIVGEAGSRLREARAQRQVQDRALVEVTQRLNRAQHEAGELRERLRRALDEAANLKRGTGAITVDGKKLPQPLAVEEAFPRWVMARGSTAVARADWVAERVRQWPLMPILGLGMILPAGTEPHLALTLRSLGSQIAGDWLLHIVAEREMPTVLAAEKRIVWHIAGERPAEHLSRHLAASAAHFVALIDAGDQLAPHALFSVADAFFRHPEWQALYTDEARIDPQGIMSAPHFKPDFNLDLMRSLPYVGALLAVRRDTFAAIGGFDPAWDGTEEYDMALRLAERAGARGFGHVADVLYHRLTVSGRSRRPVAAICADMTRIVQAHLDRLGIAAAAEQGVPAHTCRVRYRHDGPDPLVSIIVPTKNQLGLLKRCVETVLKITEYENYELIVVDNGSDEADACAYLQAIEDKYADIGSRIRVLRHPGPFNFSALNNRAVRETAQGDYICLLNNDAAPLDGAWLGEMMALARRPDIGVVGAKLTYPDGRIQHGGVLLGVGWGAPADHPYNGDPGNAAGYWGRFLVPQDMSAVTAACCVTRREVWDQVGGFDEGEFAVSFNDVDYCLKLREAGYLVVWTPYARLMHETSASLRADVERTATAEKNARFTREKLAMFRKWMPQIAHDPAHNRNLSSFGLGFAVETEGAPTWDPEFRPRERVLVYPADREGCGEYRIIAPSRALLQAGVIHAYETMRLMTPPEVARMAPDSIVFQRQLEYGQIEVIEWVKHTSKAFRVFELDDLITNLPPKSAHRPSIAPDIADRLKRALALCDRLVVSTEPMARAYGRFCGETVVMPNRLEKSRWLGLKPQRRLDRKPRVGWAGAVGHLGDLGLIAPVVEATAKEVDWVFFGMCPDALRPFVAEYHEWAPLHDYAKKLASLDLDLAVAPLEHHPFNEAKSNLRLLEYGVLGYPVLCTDILPYRGDLPVTRVDNKHRDWIRAIRDMTADRAASQRAGEELRQAVVRDWVLEDHLDEWKRAWLP
ncbi:MAG TPA: glycosyltransferase [Stellaceae bacterium]|nr:glycosyltransferase [Stellaceae bacterium]